MLIDWFTVGAQALNFLILVWLMKRFLYKPVLQAIDAREKRIAAELGDADAKKAEAKGERDEFQKKNTEFDQQRAALFSKATDDAKAERERLLGEARTAADELGAKRQETLENEAKTLGRALRRRTQDEVFAIARKALVDLAATDVEERIVHVFVERLRTLGEPEKGNLGTTLKAAPEPAAIRSAFDLKDAQRGAIQQAINETFSADVHLRFETSPDLVSGIELTASGQKVAWSIADYLTILEKGVAELLKPNDKRVPTAKPNPDAKAGPESETKTDSKTEA